MLLHFETFAMFPQLQCINLIKMQGLHLLIPESHDNFVLEKCIVFQSSFSGSRTLGECQDPRDAFSNSQGTLHRDLLILVHVSRPLRRLPNSQGSLLYPLIPGSCVLQESMPGGDCCWRTGIIFSTCCSQLVYHQFCWLQFSCKQLVNHA